MKEKTILRPDKILAAAFLILTVCVLSRLKTVYAAEKPVIEVETAEAEPGGEIRLEVSISDNPGICALRLAVNYDRSLTLVKAEDTALYGDHMFGNDMSADPYYIMWDESLKPGDNRSNGTLACLTFRVAGDALPGTYKVWITYTVGDIYNSKLQDIEAELIEGGVKISEKTTPSSVPATTPSATPTSVHELTATPTTSPEPTTPTSVHEPTATPAVTPTVVTGPTVTPATPGVTSSPAATLTPTVTPGLTADPTPAVTSEPPVTDDGSGSKGYGSEVTQSGKTKAFTVTVADKKGQTVKYKVKPAANTEDGTAGSAAIVSLKTGSKSIVIPDTVEIEGKTYKVTSIGKNALKANKKVTKLQIGANITAIGRNACRSLKKLKTIVINSDRIAKVGNGAFKGIASKATIKIKAAKKPYKDTVSLIKASGTGKNIKYTRIK